MSHSNGPSPYYSTPEFQRLISTLDFTTVQAIGRLRNNPDLFIAYVKLTYDEWVKVETHVKRALDELNNMGNERSGFNADSAGPQQGQEVEVANHSNVIEFRKICNDPDFVKWVGNPGIVNIINDPDILKMHPSITSDLWTDFIKETTEKLGKINLRQTGIKISYEVWFREYLDKKDNEVALIRQAFHLRTGSGATEYDGPLDRAEENLRMIREKVNFLIEKFHVDPVRAGST